MLSSVMLVLFHLLTVQGSKGGWAGAHKVPLLMLCYSVHRLVSSSGLSQFVSSWFLSVNIFSQSHFSDDVTTNHKSPFLISYHPIDDCNRLSLLIEIMYRVSTVVTSLLARLIFSIADQISNSLFHLPLIVYVFNSCNTAFQTAAIPITGYL